MARETDQEIIDAIKATLSPEEQKHLLKGFKPKDSTDMKINLQTDMIDTSIFFIEKKFLHNIFGDYILQYCNINRINGQLHIYKNGIYSSDKDEIFRAMQNIIPDLTEHRRKEVYGYINLKCEHEKELSPPYLVPFKSKIYDLNSDKYIDYGPEYVFLNKYPFDYNKNVPAKSSVTMLINQIADYDKEVINLLYEAIGYCFYRGCPYRGAFILYGESGNNGKSTLLNLISKLIGYKNISNLSLQDTTDRFRIAELHGKCANIGDDIPSNYIDDSSTFKKLVTGEAITVERKYEKPFTLNNYAKLFFASNELPRINDRTQAFLSRVILIPLNHDFKKNSSEYDPRLKNKEWTVEELEYLTVLAVEGLKRLIKNNGFTSPKASVDALNDYVEMNNPIIAFLNEHGEESIVNRYTEDVYIAYTTWCDSNGYKASSLKTLSKDIKKYLGLGTKTAKINSVVKRKYAKDHIKLLDSNKGSF